MNSSTTKNNPFINDVIFSKETIKALEDSIYLRPPKILCKSE